MFPICSGMVRGFSRFVPFLFLGLLRAPRRNSPERVRDTIGTFPEKSGKHPGLETPRFSFSQSIQFSVPVPGPLCNKQSISRSQSGRPVGDVVRENLKPGLVSGGVGRGGGQADFMESS